MLAVAFLAPALEASAFLGVVVPGEVAVLLGGVPAFRHRASLPAVAGAAVAGAVVGDGVGSLAGRRRGRRLLDGPVGRPAKGGHLDRAERYLASRGGPAVLFGGFAAALLVLAVRWLVGHPQRVRALALADRQLARPWVARPRGRCRRRLAFLARRRRPGGALGLPLTATVAALVAAAWAFGAVLQAVLGRDELDLVDQPVARFFVRHREAWLTRILQDASNLGSTRLLLPLILLVGVGWWLRQQTWRPLGLLAAAYAGAEVAFNTVKELVHRPRPPAAILLKPVAGPGFPSGHAAQAVAVYGTLAALTAASTPAWSRKVAAWAVAVVVAGVVAVSRLYLGAHWLTDVLGGLALGAAWLFALLASVRTIGRLRAHPPDHPAAEGGPTPPGTPAAPTGRPPVGGGRHG